MSKVCGLARCTELSNIARADETLLFRSKCLSAGLTWEIARNWMNCRKIVIGRQSWPETCTGTLCGSEKLSDMCEPGLT